MASQTPTVAQLAADTNRQISELRNEIDVLRGVICVLIGSASLSIDLRKDREQVIDYLRTSADRFENEAVGGCPGEKHRQAGIEFATEFLAKDSVVGTGRPKPPSVETISDYVGKLGKQVQDDVERQLKLIGVVELCRRSALTIAETLSLASVAHELGKRSASGNP